MTEFKLSINGGFHAAISEDFDEEDIVKLLEFDENDIEHLLKTHAATQVYWEALAIRYKNRHEIFKDDWYKKWWSHSRMYARYILKAYGYKDLTKEAINDVVVQVYSRDTSDFERKKYADLAFSIASRNKLYFEGDEVQFVELMYKYQLMDVPWYFEDITSTLHSYKEQSELVSAVADKLNSRSFHMQSLLTLVMAKSHTMGERSISDKDVSKRINEKR